MDMSHGAASLAAQSPVQVAKAALRRLALDKVEPTPENYARAYAAEGGLATPALPARARPLLQRLAAPLGDEGAALGERVVQSLMSGQWDAAEQALDNAVQQATSNAQGWADLLQRLARGLERGSRLWTAARKKDSLARVLSGSRADAQRLRLRVLHLVAAWENETDEPGIDSRHGALDEPAAGAAATPEATVDQAAEVIPSAADPGEWLALVRSLESTVRGALPEGESHIAETGAKPDAAVAARCRIRCHVRAGGARRGPVPARAARAGAPPPPDGRTGQAVRRADAEPDRTGRGRQLGPRPVPHAADAPGRRPERAQRACRQRDCWSARASSRRCCAASATRRAMH